MLYPGVNKVAVRLLQFNIIYPNISSPPSSNLVLKGLGIGISIACVAPRLVDQARPCLADQARNLSWLGRAKGQLDMERTTKKTWHSIGFTMKQNDKFRVFWSMNLETRDLQGIYHDGSLAY